MFTLVIDLAVALDTFRWDISGLHNKVIAIINPLVVYCVLRIAIKLNLT